VLLRLDDSQQDEPMFVEVLRRRLILLSLLTFVYNAMYACDQSSQRNHGEKVILEM
jgi:hypothetical protein